MKTTETNLGVIDGALKRLNLFTAGSNASLGSAFEQHENAVCVLETGVPDGFLEDLHTDLMNLRHCLNNIETELKTVRKANNAAVEELAFYKQEYYKNANGSN